MSDDRDLCQMCYAQGTDKRYLTIACGYAVDEMVPEMEKLERSERMWAPFGVNLCKSCRARLLRHLKIWREECTALRDLPKDHDGYIYEEEDENLIPVREHGITIMVTREEFFQRRKV